MTVSSVRRSAIVVGVSMAIGASVVHAGSVTKSLNPSYGSLQADATTGPNFVNGQGWYVTPGSDSHTDDFLRERPLGTNTFSSQGGQWVQGGTYFSFLDIENAGWGYDQQYLYFKMELWGNGTKTATGDWDYDAFGSGTLYNIILGQRADGEANGGLLLRTPGDKKETWTGPGGDFNSIGAQAWWDKIGDVGDSAITATKEDGELASTGYEVGVVPADGVLLAEPNTYVLFSRVTTTQDKTATKPVVEIAFDYAAWNASSGSGYRIDPEALSLVVFEANKGTQDNANYLWNDKWTQAEEGSPFNIAGINQLGNVYELDRYRWVAPTTSVVVPTPQAALAGLAGLGLLGLARTGRRR